MIHTRNRLPLGIFCAPAIWQSAIGKVLVGIEGVDVIIDDVKITAPNDKEHLGQLKTVLQRFKDYALHTYKQS